MQGLPLGHQIFCENFKEQEQHGVVFSVWIVLEGETQSRLSKRYLGVIRFIVHVLQLLPNLRFTQQNLCYISLWYTLTYLLRFFSCLRVNVTLSVISTLFGGLLHFNFETIMKNVLMKCHVCSWHFCERNVNVETHTKHGSRLQDPRLGGGSDVNGEQGSLL